MWLCHCVPLAPCARLTCAGSGAPCGSYEYGKSAVCYFTGVKLVVLTSLQPCLWVLVPEPSRGVRGGCRGEAALLSAAGGGHGDAGKGGAVETQVCPLPRQNMWFVAGLSAFEALNVYWFVAAVRKVARARMT